LRAERKHCNSRGTVHAASSPRSPTSRSATRSPFSTQPPTAAITANLSLDFAGAAKEGDWLEAKVDFQKLGSRLRLRQLLHQRR